MRYDPENPPYRAEYEEDEDQLVKDVRELVEDNMRLRLELGPVKTALADAKRENQRLCAVLDGIRMLTASAAPYELIREQVEEAIGTGIPSMTKDIGDVKVGDQLVNMDGDYQGTVEYVVQLYRGNTVHYSRLELTDGRVVKVDAGQAVRVATVKVRDEDTEPF